MNKFKEKENNNHSILSATKPKDALLNTGLKTNVSQKLRLKQKSKIKIYVSGDNKYFVEHSAAYALGIVNVRAVMMDTPKLIELPRDKYNKIVADKSYEIEYVKMEKNQTIKVYFSDNKYFIDVSAAYALGLVTVEDYYSSSEKYFPVTQAKIDEFKKSYKVEYESLEKKQEEDVGKKV